MSPHRVLQQVHQRLGTVDVEDQIAALEYVTHFVQSVCIILKGQFRSVRVVLFG